MRPYRGLTKDGKWVYGWYIPNRIAIPAVDGTVYHYVEVIPETVGQFTGLKDKNGKEGCHHDLILNPHRNSGKPIEIIWEDGGWRGLYVGVEHGRFTYGLNSVSMSMSEIIGNIHQSPDLLENKQ